MKDKVSVIVPVYGVELYLEECILSILNQTHKNLEILLIDDASPDNCGKICDEFALKDSRIKVIHKENGGAASARNAGLDAACGDYICFIDSDDSVSPDYVLHLLTLLKQADADIAVCSFAYQYKNEIIDNNITYPEGKAVRVHDALRRFLTDWTSGIAWNRLFRAELLNEIRYEEGHKIDDEFFTYKAVIKSRSSIFSNEKLYLYRMRASSVMNAAPAYAEQILNDRLSYLISRYDNVTSSYPSLKGEFAEGLADSLIRLMNEASMLPYCLKTIRKKAWRFLPTVIRECPIKAIYAFSSALIKRPQALPPQALDNKKIYFE